MIVMSIRKSWFIVLFACFVVCFIILEEKNHLNMWCPHDLVNVMDIIGKSTKKIMLLNSAASSEYNQQRCDMTRRLRIGVIVPAFMLHNSSYILELCELCEYSSQRFELFFVVENKNYFHLKNCAQEEKALDKKRNVFKPTNRLTYQVLSPVNQTLFDKNWYNSKFITCIGPETANKRRKFKLTRKNFKTFRATYEVLETLGINISLGDGTLLGWYRDCDLIEHTTDFDLFTMTNDVMRHVSMDDFTVHLHGLEINRIIGKLVDPMEITFNGKVDLFLVNRDVQGVPTTKSIIIKERKILRSTHHHVTEVLCTGILRGYVFHVPCDIENVLIESYGQKWHESVKNKVWYEYAHNQVVDSLFCENETELYWHLFENQ